MLTSWRQRLALALIFIEGLLEFVPGCIHRFKEDGGAQSIAGFINYDTCQNEILWAFHVLGTNQIIQGFATMYIVICSVLEVQHNALYTQIVPKLIAYKLLHYLGFLCTIIFGSANVYIVAPNAPGRFKAPVCLLVYVITYILYKPPQPKLNTE